MGLRAAATAAQIVRLFDQRRIHLSKAFNQNNGRSLRHL
jgi:hypothetical protein